MATTARLHWFWRGSVAALIGCLAYVVLALILLEGLQLGRVWLRWTDSIGLPMIMSRLLLHAVHSLLASIVVVIAFVTLTRRYGPATPDGETHCRQCDYILRGLSEPRCPECGEAI